MTKSELMLYAHAEARKMVGIPYREAIKFGMRRAHNRAMHLAMMAMPQPEKVNFVWLRGM